MDVQINIPQDYTNTNNEISASDDANSQSSKQTSHSTTSIVQNVRNTSVMENISIPIVGYEVMEERARFTIYKLKVEDLSRNLSWLVFRRYTDFVRLCACIHTPPPLPGKRWLRDNFEPAFLEQRARGLQVFVSALIKRYPNHPRVREFFCLDDPPQASVYQPEVQAVCDAYEDTMNTLRAQLHQRDRVIASLKERLVRIERTASRCENCRKQCEQT